MSKLKINVDFGRYIAYNIYIELEKIMKFEYILFFVLTFLSVFNANDIITGVFLICSIICLAADRILEKL